MQAPPRPRPAARTPTRLAALFISVFQTARNTAFHLAVPLSQVPGPPALHLPSATVSPAALPVFFRLLLSLLHINFAGPSDFFLDALLDRGALALVLDELLPLFVQRLKKEALELVAVLFLQVFEARACCRITFVEDLADRIALDADEHPRHSIQRVVSSRSRRLRHLVRWPLDGVPPPAHQLLDHRALRRLVKRVRIVLRRPRRRRRR
mmetsp:Transcript_12148/g.28313  ORF Transcript_12148/g.28313 Transcript_12148/m.28313 type:complete len:209 (+) Transcript_12148:388-1014(+)